MPVLIGPLCAIGHVGRALAIRIGGLCVVKKRRASRVEMQETARHCTRAMDRRLDLAAEKLPTTPAPPRLSMYARRGAACGDIVFLERDGVRRLACVTHFDGYVYSFYEWDDRDLIRTRWTLNVDYNHEWYNAPLPTCCICVEADADCALPCACRAPSVCAQCAQRITQCPMCRSDISTFEERYRKANISSIELPKTPDRYPLSIRTKRMKQRIVWVHWEWTVRTLKALIEPLEDWYPADEQRIGFGGKLLDDSATLDSCGVGMHCSVFSVPDWMLDFYRSKD